MSVAMLMLCMVMRTQLLLVSAGDVDTEEGLEIYEEYYIDTPTEVGVDGYIYISFVQYTSFSDHLTPVSLT